MSNVKQCKIIVTESLRFIWKVRPQKVKRSLRIKRTFYLMRFIGLKLKYVLYRKFFKDKHFRV